MKTTVNQRIIFSGSDFSKKASSGNIDNILNEILFQSQRCW